MVDVTVLGALLAPALPYLTRAGERVFTEASEALGGTAWEYAQRLWDKLGGRLKARPGGEEAVEDVAAAPDDAEARTVLVRQLRKLLEADPELAREVEGLLADAEGAGVVASGDRSIAFRGEAKDSNFVTGDNVRISREGPP